MNDVAKTKIRGCAREGCTIAEGGKCLQDFENAVECDQAIINDDVIREEFMTVNSGTGLSLEDVATIQQDRKVPTCSLIGSANSGKTTFLAMLFHRFLRTYKGFSGHAFMDSESFLALNEKLHYADMKSQQYSVDMPRTSLEDEPAFHFMTKDKDGNVRECIWIDIPGEAFDQRLSKGAGGWNEYRGLARAKYVVLFLDLEVICDRKLRGPHTEQSFDALAYSIQSKTWKHAKLMVVFSKADQYGKKAQQQMTRLEAKVKSRFESEFESIDFCQLHSLGKEQNVKKSLGKMWRWIHS